MKQSNNTSHYEGAILEEIRDMLIAIREGQRSLAHMPAQLHKLANKVDRIDYVLRGFVAGEKDNSRSIKDHEIRITKLEHAN